MRSLVSISCVLGLGLVLACKKDVAPPPASAPISAEEAEAYGATLARAFAGCDAEAVDALFDSEALARAAIHGSDKGTAASRRGFVRGASGSLALGTRLCTQNQGEYHLLRVRTAEALPRAVFRFLGTDGSVNYLELVLGKEGANGPVRARDVYIYMTGELMSDTMRRLYESSVDSAGSGKELFRLGEALQRATSLVHEGNHGEAQRALDELPPRLQRDKSVLLMRVAAAAGQTDEVYGQAIETFEKAFPGDPALDLVSLDGFVMKERWDDALAALERLERRVGGDAYLQALRATMHMQKGEHDRAREVARRALEAEPALEQPRWTLLDVALETGAHQDALALMTELRDEYGAVFEEEAMQGEPVFAGLLASEDYETWRARAPTPQPAAGP